MVKVGIEIVAQGIEIIALLIITGGILQGLGKDPGCFWRDSPDTYRKLKERLGKSLMLGLEILIAADIIRTVTLEPTLENAVVLAILVIIRTFLSWSLAVEIEGRWPWKAFTEKNIEN